jgi:hypothetical protein
MLEPFGVGERLQSRLFGFRVWWDVSSVSFIDWPIVGCFWKTAHVVFFSGHQSLLFNWVDRARKKLLFVRKSCRFIPNGRKFS